ncbi:ABC transporter substrate-binding protein [Mycobacterium sp. ACS4331]|uniref:ABC transporter substrate-binding protein n=1 Tax=Mycobacterium sp. ACS4331 TaxID=1834121 RepID=UPI0007FC5D21|nr:ABC transporter substrate-binding protein [Mycobacterium sp. ACS4331]OBF29217.1 iron ABC transporter substrate-binding protein [Mycobacterium sp. ACS4331]
MTPWTRREFLTATGVAGLAWATGCSSDSSGANPDSGAVTLSHAFGETTIPSPPKRVVSAGFTEQDDLLAVGTVPIATTEWFGAEPFAVWPWARSALGGAQPTVLHLDDGIQVEQIATLKPDLIVAINAGCDAATYEKLSAIAPTLPQSGRAPFFEPWTDQATAVGRATFSGDRMAALIKDVQDRFTAVGAANPRFKDKSVLLLQGTTEWEDSVIATAPGWRTAFLTQMGLVIPDSLTEFTEDGHDRAVIPLSDIGPALDAADVLIWTTDSDEQRAALLADPRIAALRATTADRNVFTTRELAGAIAFASVLSYPLVAEQLPPLLAQALS